MPSGSSVEPQAKAALSASTVPALRDLKVERRRDGLLISGRVPSFYYKQLAQEAVMAVAEGIQVINTVEVVSAPHK